MNDSICNDFQKNVEKYLVRHQSVLDILSKYHQTNGRVNRAVTKAVTQCGCIQVNGVKNSTPNVESLAEMKSFYKTQIEGQLCDNCKEILEQEIGKNLFYLTALCNCLGLDLNEVVKLENNKISTLGVFNLT